MYLIKSIDKYIVHLNDIKKIAKSSGYGILITDIEYGNSNDIHKFKNKLIIKRITDDDDFNTRQEIMYVLSQLKTITIYNGKYTPNGNNIFIYLNGEILDKSNYVETSETTIDLLIDVPIGSNIIIVYKDNTVFELPLNNVITRIFEQETILSANQRQITLIRSVNNINNCMFLIYINGSLIPKSSYILTKVNEIELLEALDESCNVLLTCFEYDNAIVSQNVVKSSKHLLLNPVHTLEPFEISNVSNINDNSREVNDDAKSKILGWFKMDKFRRRNRY